MQYLLDLMFYYKTEPIATIFLVSLVTMFISMIYIFQRAIADKDVHLCFIRHSDIFICRICFNSIFTASCSYRSDKSRS